MPSTKLAFEMLKEVYLGEDRHRIQQISDIISPQAEKIAETFYSELMKNSEARRFLDNDLVSTRLVYTMADWIRSLFAISSEPELEAFIERQKRVGEIHARIKMPMYLVMHAARILRTEFVGIIKVSAESSMLLVQSFLITSDILEYAVTVINDSFVTDALRDEREAQSLRDNMLGRDVAVECERARAALYDWARKVTGHLYRNAGKPPTEQLSLFKSDFGLWLMYRAEFMLPDSDDLESIRVLTKELEKVVRDSANDPAALSVTVTEDLVEKKIGEISTILSNLTERTLAMDMARDPLTRMLNRQYLPTVLQREVRLSSRHNVPFSLMILDLDFFKQINDTHGHDAGDAVLRQFAVIILGSVRTSDFAFRYGGEEFIIVLGNAAVSNAQKIGEKIRRQVEGANFELPSEEMSKVTVSIGITEFAGHPDYTQVLQRADKALYQAKQTGRNRCVVL